MLTHLVAGMFTGLGLIVAIGAQNAFVLRQGLARDHIGVIVAICAVSDLFLIFAGTAGLGALIGSHPTALTVLRWVGAAYLVWFGVRSLWAARHASALAAGPARSRGSIVATTLALTFLNPHVYLDTVLMLGSIGATFGDQRWIFAGGAITGSLIWFPGLALAGRRLSGFLARPRTWQTLNALIGVAMLTIAGLLIRG